MVQQARAKVVPPSMFIDQHLQHFSDAELRDVIRLSQRLLAARGEEARSRAEQVSAKKTWRFWDRPLELDWSCVGVPRVYPEGRAKGAAEVDWSVFKLLQGSARDTWQVDWEVFELLAPRAKKVEEINWDLLELLSPMAGCNEPEEEPGVLDFAAVDWSGSRLPHQQFAPPRRRPGRPGRVRAGQHHRAVEPRRRCGGAEAGLPLTACFAPEPRHRLCSFEQKVRSPTSRRAMRIQQPGGGGR